MPLRESDIPFGLGRLFHLRWRVFTPSPWGNYATMNAILSRNSAFHLLLFDARRTALACRGLHFNSLNEPSSAAIWRPRNGSWPITTEAVFPSHWKRKQEIAVRTTL